MVFVASCTSLFDAISSHAVKMAGIMRLFRVVRKEECVAPKYNQWRPTVNSRTKTQVILKASKYRIYTFADPANLESRQFLKFTRALEKRNAAAKSNRHIAEFKTQILERRQTVQNTTKRKAEQM